MGLFSRRLVIAAAVLASCSSVWAQPGQPDASPPQRVAVDGVVTVPMTLVSNLPIVEARINGQGPFRFGIETGANLVLVSPDVVSRLSLTPAADPTTPRRIASTRSRLARRGSGAYR